MPSNNEFHIAVMAGDGIATEIMPPCLELLNAVGAQVGGYTLSFEHLEAGAGLYKETGTALPDEVVERAGKADAILLGAMGLPDVRYPDGREIAPQVDLREIFELFAGVRPVRTYPGLPLPLADERAHNLDFVLIRESTEGLFAGRGHTVIDGDGSEEKATDIQVITRKGSERLFDYGFELARKRKARGYRGELTCIDKANILGGFAFFRKIFYERAEAYPDIKANHAYVDATALGFVRNPWVYDVLVTENMYGDILSDLGAGLMGGMGLAPSADIGHEHAVFQPCHGTAPDIMGTGKANPTAMYLSAAMMLDWLGETHGMEACVEAGARLQKAVEGAFAGGGLRPYEMGGTSGLREITAAVTEKLNQAA
jgi:3-isopropylmalate dehydrogenase